MPKLEKTITLQDACTLVGQSKDVFAPIKEAISNSFDSIIQRQRCFSKDFKPEVNLSFYFVKNVNLALEENTELSSVVIKDNGIGFTRENLCNFKALASKSKGMNNRGTGLIQMFCRFSKLTIHSIFNEDDKWKELNLSWDKTGEYACDVLEKTSDTIHCTSVELSDFCGNPKELDFFLSYIHDISHLKSDILKYFLLRLWLGSQETGLSLTIQVYKDGTCLNSYVFDSSNIPIPDKTEYIKIATEQAKIKRCKSGKSAIEIVWEKVDPEYTLTINRFKIPSRDANENAIYLCSNGITICQIKFPTIKRKDTVFDGYRFITSIQGTLLDDPSFITHTVDGFTFPDKKRLRLKYQNLMICSIKKINTS